MELPGLRVATVGLSADVCAVCDRPCLHELEENGLPFPGGYDDASTRDEHRVPTPICDPCVERHYPDRVAEVEAARLYYWTH